MTVVSMVRKDLLLMISFIFGVVFLVLGAASAWASTGTGLPSNIFEYGFAGAGYIILSYFCYRLLNIVKGQYDEANDLVKNNTQAMQELKSAIEGKLIGKK